MTAPPREPVAWIWNGYEGTGTRSLRWSKPTQWDFVPGGISPLYAAPAPSAEPIKNRVSDGSRQFPPHRDPGRVSLPMEGNDDDKSNGGRARGMAGEGDGNHLRSGCRDGEAGRDRSGEHDAGLLHPQQHADRRGGNATRLLIDNETLRQQIAADPDDSEPSAGSVEPPATDAAEMAKLLRMYYQASLPEPNVFDDDVLRAADLIERQAREIADYKQKWIECAAERTALSAQLADGYHAAGLSRHVGILVNRAERAEAERDALRADAERYRWLRQPNPLSRAAHIAVLTHNGGWVASGEQADAAIDAARAKVRT